MKGDSKSPLARRKLGQVALAEPGGRDVAPPVAGQSARPGASCALVELGKDLDHRRLQRLPPRVDREAVGRRGVELLEQRAEAVAIGGGEARCHANRNPRGGRGRIGHVARQAEALDPAHTPASSIGVSRGVARSLQWCRAASGTRWDPSISSLRGPRRLRPAPRGRPGAWIPRRPLARGEPEQEPPRGVRTSGERPGSPARATSASMSVMAKTSSISALTISSRCSSCQANSSTPRCSPAVGTAPGWRIRSPRNLHGAGGDRLFAGRSRRRLWPCRPRESGSSQRVCEQWIQLLGFAPHQEA